MTSEMFEHVLVLAGASRIKLLQFTGSEPTLNKEMVKMARTAKERGFSLILRTHGRNLSKLYSGDNKHTWAEAVTNCFDEVIVSFDGTANANFKMRPVIRSQRLFSRAGADAYADLMEQAAHKQFAETVEGYEALSEAVEGNAKTTIKINTAVAQANIDNMPEFGAFLSCKLELGRFRIDCWDFTQVFPSTESTIEEQAGYIVTEEAFFRSVVFASLDSTNVPKRAKPRTSARCLIVDETGRIYFGGAENHELGFLGRDSIATVSQRILDYDHREDLSSQRTQKYLSYSPKGLR